MYGNIYIFLHLLINIIILIHIVINIYILRIKIYQKKLCEKSLGVLENGFIPYGIHLEWTSFGKWSSHYLIYLLLYSKTIPNVFHRVFPQIFVICLVTCLGFGKIWLGITLLQTISDSGYIQPQYKILSKQTLLLL